MKPDFTFNNMCAINFYGESISECLRKFAEYCETWNDLELEDDFMVVEIMKGQGTHVTNDGSSVTPKYVLTVCVDEDRL